MTKPTYLDDARKMYDRAKAELERSASPADQLRLAEVALLLHKADTDQALLTAVDAAAAQTKDVASTYREGAERAGLVTPRVQILDDVVPPADADEELPGSDTRAAGRKREV